MKQKLAFPAGPKVVSSIYSPGYYHDDYRYYFDDYYYYNKLDLLISLLYFYFFCLKGRYFINRIGFLPENGPGKNVWFRLNESKGNLSARPDEAGWERW